jgi:hypothetical protein
MNQYITFHKRFITNASLKYYDAWDGWASNPNSVADLF